MAESRKQAEVSSKSATPDAWDAGLHAESAAGPIDVGLSVEPSAVGLIIDAPGIGLLKLAFDLHPDGSARLSRASRRLSDGRDAELVAIDEPKVQELQGALGRLQRAHEELMGTLSAEREERASASPSLSGATSDAGLDSTSATLTGELADARAELDRLKAQLEVGGAELAEELIEAKAELAFATAQLEERGKEASDALARVAEAEVRLAATEGRYISSESQISAERDNARARVAAVDDAVKHEVEAREFALATERKERARLAAELEELTTELLAARAKQSALESELEAAYTARSQAETELETLRGSAAEAAATQAQLLADLETAHTDRSQLQMEVEALKANAGADTQAQLIADLEAAYTARSDLQTQLEALRASSEAAFAELDVLKASSAEAAATQAQLVTDLQVASVTCSELEVELEKLRAGDATQTRLLTEVEYLRGVSADSGVTQAQLSAELEIAVTSRTQLEEELAAAVAARAHLEGELTVAREEYAQLAAELGNAKMSVTLDPEIEASLSKAHSRSDALQSQLAAAEARMGAESAATREARDVAVKLKAQADKLTAERDEARALARQLHVKLGAPKKGEADLKALIAERDHLTVRLEAMGRMIEQERDGKARAMSERDEWQLRFKALAKGNVDVSQPLDFSREETRSYFIERETVPEMPAATDPAIPRKKGS